MTETTEADLLLPFERHYLRDPLREYTRIKRNNRFATIQAHPKIWASFALLDSILERELRDLRTAVGPNALLPLSLFIFSFHRIRIGFELAFTGFVNESADIMRGAIECGAQAQRISSNPQLAEVWLNKDQGKDQLKAYRDVFERQKKDRLFVGQTELHHYWAQFSEWGTHSSKAALALKLRFKEGEVPVASFELFEVDHARLSKFLLMLIDATHRLEVLLFISFKLRLDLDVDLGKMRRQFTKMKMEAVAAYSR